MKEPSEPGAFARAAVALGKKRPLRSPRLRRIVAEMRDGNVGGAGKALLEYLAQNPRDAAALFLMARALYRQDRREEALEHLQTCLAIAPDFTAARSEYAKQLAEMNRYAAALAELDVLLEEEPANPLFRELKAGVLGNIGDNAQSAALYGALALENPERAESWVSYGDTLRIAGAQQEGIDAYRRAIASRASCGQAYYSLANLKTFRFDAADIAAMHEQVAKPDLSPGDRAGFQFALGKAYEDAGDYKRSWEQYATVNAAMRVESKYNPDALTAAVTANKKLFTPDFLRSREGWGCTARDPIFVLGRPRSGSTLVERYSVQPFGDRGHGRTSLYRQSRQKAGAAAGPGRGAGHRCVVGAGGAGRRSGRSTRREISGLCARASQNRPAFLHRQEAGQFSVSPA